MEWSKEKKNVPDKLIPQGKDLSYLRSSFEYELYSHPFFRLHFYQSPNFDIFIDHEIEKWLWRYLNSLTDEHGEND